MAKGLKELRRRIKSIQNTKKITRAMEMVAAAKLRRTQGLMEASKPFTRKLEALLSRLSRSSFVEHHPLFQRREVTASQPPLLVLLTSDRGLAGAFNTNLIKAATKYLAANPTANVWIIGRKGRDYFRRRIPGRIIGTTMDLNGRVDADVANELTRKFLGMWEKGEVSRIDIISPEVISTSQNRPQVSRFLPLEGSAFGDPDAAENQAAIDYILEPSPEAVFNAIVPAYLNNKIYLTMAEGYTAEHSSRMLAMNAATKNSDELRKVLSLQANKARQAAITTEIIEIVAGAGALQG